AEARLAERIRTLGGEFGATSGRPRRCGWFDAVVVRYAVRVNGLTGLAVTKLDVLDSFSHIPVCVGYRLDGEPFDSMPAEVERLTRVEPAYETLPGWQKWLSHVRRLADLPPAARADLDRRQDLAHAPIQYVSVGTRRDQYHEVQGVQRRRDGFELTARHPGTPEPETVQARHLVHATGYFESPNPVGVPGEDLPHVSHFFTEPHPYWQQRVVVIGGGNSAVEAALDLYRVGARVTLVHFLGEFDRGVKPWILPDVTNRVKDGSIAVRWCSRVIEIRRSEVVIRSEVGDRLETLSTDFVLALTGYREREHEIGG